MNDIFYYKPDIPFYTFVDDCNLVRVRMFKYVDGDLDSILADWGYNQPLTEFSKIANNCPNEGEPFCFILKDTDGSLYFPATHYPLRKYAKEVVEQVWCGDGYENLLNDIKNVACPVLTKEEAIEYVYHDTIELCKINNIDTQSCIHTRCDLAAITLESMPLSVGTLNRLKAADVDNLADLLQYTRPALLTFRFMNKKSIIEIEEYIDSLKKKNAKIRLGMKMDEINKIYL